MIEFNKKFHEKYNWVDHKNNFIGYEEHCETIGHAYIHDLKELDDISDSFGEEVETSNFDLATILEHNKKNNYSFGTFGVYKEFLFYVSILSKLKVVGYIVIYNFHDRLYYNLVEGKINELDISIFV